MKGNWQKQMEMREHHKRFRQRHKDRLNKKVKETTRLLKDKVYKKLGDKCSNPACQWLNADGTRGCTDRRCLQIDHVNGGGNKDRRGCYITWYRKVFNDCSGAYQLICANCNWIKRAIRGEWFSYEQTNGGDNKDGSNGN